MAQLLLDRLRQHKGVRQTSALFVKNGEHFLSSGLAAAAACEGQYCWLAGKLATAAAAHRKLAVLQPNGAVWAAGQQAAWCAVALLKQQLSAYQHHSSRRSWRCQHTHMHALGAAVASIISLQEHACYTHTLQAQPIQDNNTVHACLHFLYSCVLQCWLHGGTDGPQACGCWRPSCFWRWRSWCSRS